MKLDKDFLLREVAGSMVVVPVGDAAARFNGMIKLNDTGVFLWRRLSEGADEDALCHALCAEYEVDEAQAREDIRRFVATLRGAQILTD